MAPQQLNRDLAGLEIESLELIPLDIDERAGEHDVTEIGASCRCGPGRCLASRNV